MQKFLKRYRIDRFALCSYLHRTVWDFYRLKLLQQELALALLVQPGALLARIFKISA